MNYANKATSRTPAHIIYVLDVSGSMRAEMPGTKKRKIDFISELLEELAYQIYLRARRGSVVAERYRLAIFAYNNSVIEVTNGDYITIKDFLEGIPEFGDLGNQATNTVQAMARTKDLLKKTISKIGPEYPAPVVCHLTDGEYTKDYGDPSGVMQEIMNMETPDGKVLLENIYLGNKILSKPISNTQEWEGVSAAQELSDPYAKFLYDHSSFWPDSYAKYFNEEYKFNIRAKTKMFFPAEDVETVKMAFTASAATPTGIIEVPVKVNNK